MAAALSMARRAPAGGIWQVMMDGSDACRICGSALTPHQRNTGGVCAGSRCRLAAERQSLEADRAAAAAVLGIEDADRYTIFAVPRNERPITTLPAKRRRKFLNYLKSLAEAAVDPALPEPAPETARLHPEDPEPFAPLPERETALLGQACAACRGFCCSLGGDHAFLTAAFFRQRLADDLDLTAEDLAATYARHLPERSFRDACVFQAEAGCSLPTDLRPAICNAYHCQGLKTYRKKLEQYGPTKGCALVREDNRTHGAVLFDEEGRRSHDAVGRVGEA